MAAERVQKILAQAGIASRRKAEELIVDGLVTINGKVAKLGDKADFESDAIKVKGKLLHAKEEPVYLAFFKPKGVISMLADNENRPTIADYLTKVKARVFPVGRLDFNSEGLILLTNDGAFAEKVQKTDGIPRVYHVKVRGRPEASQVSRLEKGARMGNRMIRPHSVRLAEELANKIRVEAVFTDSGAIDVKGLFEHTGFLVERITRTAIGHITLRGLVPGHYRILKPSQVLALTEQPELGLKRLEFRDEKDERPKRTEEGGFRYRKTGRDRKATSAASGASRSAGKIVIKPLAEGERPAPRKPSFGKPAFGEKRGAGRGGFGKKPYGEKRGFGEKRGGFGGGSRGPRGPRTGGTPRGGGGKIVVRSKKS